MKDHHERSQTERSVDAAHATPFKLKSTKEYLDDIQKICLESLKCKSILRSDIVRIREAADKASRGLNL